MDLIAHPNRGRKTTTTTGNAPFVVTTDKDGETLWLWGTTWTSDPDRASVFDSFEEARAALDATRQFDAKTALVAKIVGKG